MKLDCFRLRKLQGLDPSNRASIDLGRLRGREERLLDTLSRGVEEVVTSETREGESDKCDTEDGDERGSIQRGDIEIDISSIESNSEVSTPLINNPLFISP